MFQQELNVDHWLRFSCHRSVALEL